MSFNLIMPTPKVAVSKKRHGLIASPYDVDTAQGRDFLTEMRNTTTHQESTTDYHEWLPFAAREYHISPNLEDYVIVNTPMVPSDISNRNGVAFPLGELVKFRPGQNRVMYKCWAGCPTHLEHASEDMTGALGLILDTSLVPIRSHGNGMLMMVMALLAFDKNKYPERASQIMQGAVNTYSMGATCEFFTCGLTGVRLDDPAHEHRLEQEVEFGVLPNMITGIPGLLFRNAHNLTAIECSTVDDPAWVPAFSDTTFVL